MVVSGVDRVCDTASRLSGHSRTGGQAGLDGQMAGQMEITGAAIPGKRGTIAGRT